MRSKVRALRAHTAARRAGQAEVLLKGLGFVTADLQRPTRLLSGGWRMRVALAKALLAKPNAPRPVEMSGEWRGPAVCLTESACQGMERNSSITFNTLCVGCLVGVVVVVSVSYGFAL